jgi:hypothetical protein
MFRKIIKLNIKANMHKLPKGYESVNIGIVKQSVLIKLYEFIQIHLKLIQIQIIFILQLHIDLNI